MESAAFSSKMIRAATEENIEEFLSATYATMLFQSGNIDSVDEKSEVAAKIECAYPVWVSSTNDFKPSRFQFSRDINGIRRHFFPVSEEMVGLSFTSESGSASLFVRIRKDSLSDRLKILSTFIVDRSLFSRISLAMRKNDLYPRILFAHGTGQVGLLFTKVESRSGGQREHGVLYIPELSLGVSDDIEHLANMSLSKFISDISY